MQNSSKRRRKKRLRIAVAFVPLLLAGYESGARGASNFTVRAESEKVDPNAFDKVYYIDVFDGPTIIKKIACRTDAETLKPCYPVKLSDGKFLLVDCYSHDAVATTCALTKYSAEGELDNTFKTPFATAATEMRQGKGEIKSLDSVTEDKSSKGFVLLTGDFILKDIDGLSDFERNFCINEDCVGFVGRSSHATITLNTLGEIMKKNVHEKAVFPYTKEQAEHELKRLIAKEEGLVSQSGPDVASHKKRLAKYTNWYKELNSK